MMSEPFVNRQELRVLAMRRSGHHAVMHWIARQQEGPALFLNSCELDGDGRLIGNRFSRYYGLSPAEQERDRAGDTVAKDLLIFNVEQCGIEEFAALMRAARPPGRSRRVRHLIVVRDPFNWAASQLGTLGIYTLEEGLIETWKGHLRECLGRTRVLPDPLAVDFTRWVDDEGYRRRLAAELGLAFSDRGFREVLLPGGSSWSSDEVRADNSVTGERWRKFVGVEEFWANFDAETLELAEAFFGFNPMAGEAQAGHPMSG